MNMVAFLALGTLIASRKMPASGLGRKTVQVRILSFLENRPEAKY